MGLAGDQSGLGVVGNSKMVGGRVKRGGKSFPGYPEQNKREYGFIAAYRRNA